MAILVKRSKKYPKAIKNAYNMLVEFRRLLEDYGDYERAKDVELVYKELWCEALDEQHPW